MNKTDFSMPTISSTFDLCGSNPYGDVIEISRLADISPSFIKRIEDAPNGWPQCEVGFFTNEDAIAFTEVYLDTDNASDVGEYLGFDAIAA